MFSSTLVNYGIPAVVVVVLIAGLLYARSRRSISPPDVAAGSPRAVSSESPPDSAPSVDSTLFASSHESSSTTPRIGVDDDADDSTKAGADSGTFELATSDGSASGVTVESGAIGGTEAGEAAVESASVRERTSRTRSLFSSAFASIRGKGKVDESTWEELEETLLRADIGIGLTTRLLEPLRAAAKSGSIRTPDDAITALRHEMTQQLSQSNRRLNMNAEVMPNVWLFVGVNGVGKTTTIGKIATAEVGHGTKVLLAAGDTFRAAAAEQLQVWAERSGAAFVRGSEGGDPASVIFDGIQSAHARNIDLVLGDTAGRLQNKSNLMEELKKVRRVAEKAEGTVNEVLLVIDATTGQNGLSQAKEFAAATDVTGVVLTKLDGSAKGGIVFAIETEMGIPVKLVGLGEGPHDLVAFDPAEFVAALFD